MQKQNSHVAAAEPQDDEEETLDASSVAAGQTAAFDAEQLPGQSLHEDEGQSEAATVASTPSSTSVVLPGEESPDHARLVRNHFNCIFQYFKAFCENASMVNLATKPLCICQVMLVS